MEFRPSEESLGLLEAARALRPEIVAAREEIEQGRRLPVHLVAALKQARIFRMTMPRAWGGPEVDLLTQLRIIEELSAADGSVGWCVMIGCDSGYFSALLDQRVAREMYSDLDIVTGSSFGKPAAGRAERVDGGFRVSGRWRFSSGCQHSAWLAGGSIVYESGRPKVDVHGVPETRLCFLPQEKCEIIDTWNTTGLRGSGSHDFAAQDIFVPEAQTFSWQRPQVYRPGPLYAFPLIVFAKLGAVPLGIARETYQAFSQAVRKLPGRQFIEEGHLTPEITMAGQVHIQTAVAHAETLIGSARAYLFEVMGELWETLVAGGLPDPTMVGRFFASLLYSQSASVEAVDMLYKAAGGPAVYASGPLDRPFRDIHTINQHVIQSLKSYEIAGRLLLGVPPLELLI